MRTTWILASIAALAAFLHRADPVVDDVVPRLRDVPGDEGELHRLRVALEPIEHVVVQGHTTILSSPVAVR